MQDTTTTPRAVSERPTPRLATPPPTPPARLPTPPDFVISPATHQRLAVHLTAAVLRGGASGTARWLLERLHHHISDVMTHS